MAHGGARSGAGRPKGRATNLADKAREEALQGGISPLEYLLGVMRDEDQDDARRLDAAKAAAPYVHARLASAEIKADVSAKIDVGPSWLPPGRF
jgi:hypothetical protein